MQKPKPNGKRKVIKRPQDKGNSTFQLGSDFMPPNEKIASSMSHTDRFK